MKHAYRPAAVIFDVDGVLFDTEPLHRKAWAEVLLEQGIRVKDEDLLPWTGISCRIMAGDVIRIYHVEEPGENLVARKTQLFEKILERELVPFPGLRDTLLELRRCLPLGYATGSTRSDLSLMFRLTGMEGIFTAGITADDVKRLKPEPETYVKAAEKLGLRPEDCFAVEDSPAGIAASLAAGLRTLAVCSSLAPEHLAPADMTFDTTLDACRWILGKYY